MDLHILNSKIVNFSKKKLR